MFGLCNQVVISWFTVQNHSDSCNFVAVVTGAKTVLRNSFSDSDLAKSVKASARGLGRRICAAGCMLCPLQSVGDSGSLSDAYLPTVPC